MRVGTAFAAWGVACALALTGCSGGDDQAGGPTPSGPPAATTTPTATASAHHGPPVLPALAREHSNAGAKAFVRYYIDVVNYAYKHLRPQLLVPLSPRSCTLCSANLEVLRRLHRDGGQQLGGRMSATQVLTGPFEPHGTRLYFARIHVSPGKSRATHGDRFKPIEEQRFMLEFDLLWTPALWSIDDVRPA
jgi:hypothetical protein